MAQDSETMLRRMREQFLIKFDAELETQYSIFVCRYVSERADGDPFTPEQAAWIAGYEAGYSDAGFS